MINETSENTTRPAQNSTDDSISQQDIIAESWQRCRETGIDPQMDFLPRCSPEELRQRRGDTKDFFFLSHNLLQRLSTNLGCNLSGLAAFDPDGCLLSLYGPDDFKHWTRREGIVPGTLWNEQAAGCNAVAVGIRTQSINCTGPREHFCRCLSGLKICFSPCRIGYESSYIVSAGRKVILENEKCCGIAIICPQDQEIEVYRALILGLVMLIGQWMFSIDLISDFLGDEASAVFMLANIKNHRYVAYPNKVFYELFLTEGKTDSYIPIEEIIPPEENPEFYTLLNQRKIVTNHNIALNIKGERELYQIATWFVRDKQIDIEAIYFQLKSIRKLNAYFANKTGNAAQCTFKDIVGNSEDFQSAVRIGLIASQSSINVLLTGESGVGKDLFAQAIHNASARSDKPFVVVNCAAIPRDLISSELFGYEQGAFTGSKKGGQIGKFELADGGTLFLDEIGDMPLDLQAVLLRTVEQKSFMRIGSNRVTHVDVRIIAATNVDLLEAVRQKRFRQDLYYRLSGIRIAIPPLRDRPGDIQLLAGYFLKRSSVKLYGRELAFSQQMLDYLSALPWEGNVRELQNFVENLIYFNSTDIVSLEQMAGFLTGPHAAAVSPRPAPPSTLPASRYCADYFISAEELEQALQKNRNNKVRTAEALQISRSTLYKLLKKYHLN